METIAKITRYSYNDKTNVDSRYKMVKWYEDGYTISSIARASGIHTDSVRHHLKAFGVLELHRRPKHFHEIPYEEFINKRIFINKNWPLRIQEVYIKMYQEDEEMRRRALKRKTPQINKRNLAVDPRVFHDTPFVVAIHIDL